MSINKPLKDLHHSITQKVLGQDELVSKILLTLQLHDLKQQGNGFKTSIISNLLILGNTGTGKTMAVRECVKAFGFTLLEFNAKTFAQEGGWAGKSFSSQLEKQWVVGRTYAPVIFIDEIDKIIKSNYESNGSDVNLSIQEGLLKFMEGAKIQRDAIDPGIDLSNACFIFAGAFTDLFKERTKSTMGFFGAPEIDKDTTHQKLINYGMMEELLGRINRVVRTNDITMGLLYNIANNHHNMYNQYRMLLDNIGIKSPEQTINLGRIVEKAFKLNLGVRGLNQIFMEEIDRLVELQFTDKTIEQNLNPYHIRRLT